jgi:hypothetical protein
LFLVPDPAAPFIAVREIVPHLTVAVGAFAADALRAALEPQLPIACRARELWLIAQGPDGTWAPRDVSGGAEAHCSPFSVSGKMRP